MKNLIKKTACISVIVSLSACQTAQTARTIEPIHFNKPVSVQFNNISTEIILNVLANYSQTYLVYQTKPTTKISLLANDSSFGAVFKAVLKSQCLSYKPDGLKITITKDPDKFCKPAPNGSTIRLK